MNEARLGSTIDIFKVLKEKQYRRDNDNWTALIPFNQSPQSINHSKQSNRTNLMLNCSLIALTTRLQLCIVF